MGGDKALSVKGIKNTKKNGTEAVDNVKGGVDILGISGWSGRLS
ncbi:hypothetical protein NXX42_00215 [Bacteroides thetaiotaomicron]|nr:hypothetical protein [Bacteroides thetaiotaomicron]